MHSLKFWGWADDSPPPGPMSSIEMATSPFSSSAIFSAVSLLSVSCWRLCWRREVSVRWASCRVANLWGCVWCESVEYIECVCARVWWGVIKCACVSMWSCNTYNYMLNRLWYHNNVAINPLSLKILNQCCICSVRTYNVHALRKTLHIMTCQ